MTPDPAREGARTAPGEQHQYPCSSCGAALEFAPGSAGLLCPYCGSRTTIATAASPKHDFGAYAGTPHTAPADLPPFSVGCGHCGTTQTTSAVSGRCPSCSSALVVTDDLGGQLKAPDGIVPFSIEKEQADQAFRDWSRSRWFAPNALKKVVRTDSMAGAYVPHWGFDDRTTTDYTGRRGEHYWDTETYTVTENGHTETRTRQVQRTRWYPAAGRVARDFVDLLVPGVDSPDHQTLEKLGPWSAAGATGYESEFLAGFDTPRYTVTPEAGFGEARRRMAEQIERDCREDIGGDEQQVTSTRTTDTDVLFRLLLMPLWLATYVVAGHSYHVYVNANTGKVVGERPYSAVKIALTVVAALCAVALVVLLVQTRRT
ncbi:MAG: hypothetical protein ACXVWU_04425 [Nocardioides sp.]